MSKFIQMHILTSYPASNLNRDDLGQPKTVTVVNSERLRVSSQSLKRAWRTSAVFQTALAGAVGTRTKELGVSIHHALTLGLPLADVLAGESEPGSLTVLKEKPAVEIARAIAGAFGKIKAEYKGKKDEEAAQARKNLLESLEIEQLAHISPAELEAVAELVEQCRESGKAPDAKEIGVLRKENMAADVALFGRMLAASKQYNVDASVQVAHAMTVHRVAVEEDFFTAVDDLNREDSGAGHMGVAEFGAGLFYLYICADRDLLVENLGGNAALADKALGALLESACTVSPTGKQNSYASRAYASYCLVEKGDDQPRSLAVAFLDGLDGGGGNNGQGGLLSRAVDKLQTAKQNFDRVYGGEIASSGFNAASGEGSLAEVLAFIKE